MTSVSKTPGFTGQPHLSTPYRWRSPILCLGLLLAVEAVGCAADDANAPDTSAADDSDGGTSVGEGEGDSDDGADDSTSGDEGSDGADDEASTEGSASEGDEGSDADEGSDGDDGDEGGASSGDTADEGTDAESGEDPSLDEQIAELLAAQELAVVPLERPDPPTPELFALGEALFFDPLLSGNKDIACATCHHPSFGSSDGIHLSLGTGATGLGPPRQDSEHRQHITRHSPTLFNIGDASVTNLFWDGRIELLSDDTLRTPAGDQLPEGLEGVLAAQALFPLLDRLEMRGEVGDETVLGELNELAEFDDEERPAIWAAIMSRLAEYEAYVELFELAYPERTFAEMSIVEVGNAIAAYQREAFAFPDTRWDDYLRGDLNVLTEDEKWGVFHFYNDNPTSGLCSNCHAGPLFTDQKFHDTGIAQLGPGHSDSPPFDLGRTHVTEAEDDRFLFRTPTLRNLAVSAPYMHNGSLTSLDAVLRHYRGPATTAGNVDVSLLHPDLVETVQNDEAHLMERQGTLSDLISKNVGFGALNSIGLFLEVLNDPSIKDLADLRPESVPSGLQVP